MGLLKDTHRMVPKEYYPFYRQTWDAPDAAAATVVFTGQATDSASTTSVTSFTDPDFPRALSITPAGTTADVAAGNIEVTGTDYNDTAITENIAVVANQSTTSTGTRMFKTVTQVDIPTQDDDGATYSMGIGAALGLERKLHADVVILATVDGTYEGTRPTVAYNSSDVASNSIAFNTAPDASRDFEILYYYTGLNTNPA